MQQILQARVHVHFKPVDLIKDSIHAQGSTRTTRMMKVGENTEGSLPKAKPLSKKKVFLSPPYYKE